MHHKTKVSEIQDYRNMLLKIRIKSIRVYSVIFGSIVFMFFWVGDPTEECGSASPAAIMKFLCPIIQCNPVDTLNKAFGNIAQTYGIALGLLAAFTLYKMGRVADRLAKTVNDSLELREKYDKQAVTKEEKDIISWYSCILKTKRVLPFRDRDRLKYYVDSLQGNAKLRESMLLDLHVFIVVHSILIVAYILFLFLHNTEFIKTRSELIITSSLLLLLASFFVTLKHGATVAELHLFERIRRAFRLCFCQPL